MTAGEARWPACASRWWNALPLGWRTALVFAAACLVRQAYARAPMMGDDIDYFGFALHRVLPRADFPAEGGFHFLRWTVWGPIWAWMCAFGPGPAAYDLVPAASLGACCAMTYRIGRRLLHEAGGVAAALVLLFHPLMNDLILRPMPDIVEAVLVTLGFLLLWRRLEPGERDEPLGSPWAAGGAMGLLVFLSWVNRPTGLIWFIAAVMLSAIFAPRRLLPLFPPAVGVFALCFAIEGAVYLRLFDDFWHGWHANQLAADRKGTDAVALWWLPLRYLGVVASGGLLKSLLLVCSLAGGVVLWRGGGARGKFAVGWCVLLYLGVSCALQSAFPFKPLVRIGERFIGGLAIPLSLLAAAGLDAGLRRAAARWPRLATAPAWVAPALGLAALIGLSSREWRDPAFLPALRAWLAALPADAVVAADGDAYEAAFIAAPAAARALRWEIVSRREVPGASALPGLSAAGHLLVCRPRLMVTVRKQLESARLASETRLPAELFGPAMPWVLADVAFQPFELDREARALGASRGARAPDFLWFCKRLAPAEPRGGILAQASGWEWRADGEPPGTLGWRQDGALAFRRSGGGQARFLSPAIGLPPGLRGRAVQVRALLSSAQPEPFDLCVAFRDAKGRSLGTQVMRTYAAPWGLWDFNAFRVPEGAETARLLVGAKSNCREFVLRDLRLDAGAGK